MALNWGREQQRKRIARHGTEDAMAITALFAPLTKPLRRPLPPSKAELRAQAAEALESFQVAICRSPAAAPSAGVVIVRCRGGHMANAKIPRSLKSARFRCTKCSRRQRVNR
jgi:hypothetical protein